jgi:hypothetical protein
LLGLCPIAADKLFVALPATAPAPNEDLAALAFSVLSSQCAEVVNRRLTIQERAKLREGLARVRDASDADRAAAVRALASAVQDGVDWPVPNSHDDHDCPFSSLGSYPHQHVIDVIDRISVRDPIACVVALCHMEPSLRDEVWNGVSAATRSAVLPRLNEVHLVSVNRTREYAREVNTRMTRAIRFGASR